MIDLNIFQGDYGDAIQYMEKMIELSPNDKTQGLELFQLYIHEGELEKAPKLLDTLLKYNPDDIDILYAKANIQYSKNDWENLLRTYHLIYLSNTENSDILMNIYEVGTATGQETLSLALLNDINTQNESPQLLEFLIDLHSRLQEYSEAINNIKKLIKFDNNSEERTLQLGVLYLFNKQFDAVITTLEPLYQNGNYSLEVLRPLLIAYSTVNNTDYQIKISQTLI